MTFEEKFQKILKERGVSKTSLAKNLGIPWTTFSRRQKDLSSWSVPEFNKMVETLRLTDEEVTFLTSVVD